MGIEEHKHNGKPSRTVKVPFFSSVRTRLLLAFSVVTSLAIGIAIVALVAQDKILERQQHIQEARLPAMSAALEVQSLSSSIVAIGPQIIAAQSSDVRNSAMEPIEDLENEALSAAHRFNKLSSDQKRRGVGQTDSPAETGEVQMIKETAQTIKGVHRVSEELERLRCHYQDLIDQTHTAIFFIERRIDVLFEDTYADSATSSRQSRARDSQLSQTEEAILEWSYRVSKTATTLRSEVDYLSLIDDEGQALKMGSYFEDLLAEMDSYISGALVEEHGKMVIPDYDKLVRILDNNNPKGLVATRAKIIRLDDELNQLQVSNEKISRRLNNAVMAGLGVEARSIADEVENVHSVISGSEKSVKIAALSALVGALLIGFMYVHRGLLRRLVKLNVVMDRLAEGDVDVDIPINKHDEITRMAKSVQVFKDNILEARGVRSKLASEFDSKMSGMLNNISAMVGSMESTATTMRNSASSASEQSKEAQQALHDAQENVDLVSESTRQMVIAIQEIESKTTESEQEVVTASEKAKSSKKTLTEMVDSAQKVEKFVNIITEVAEKTNLLSLNASIEAARAGDAGRGFAVVANEVKDLASGTADSSREIREIVNDIQLSSGMANAAITEMIERIEVIETAASAVASAVVEQSAVTQEIDNSSRQVVKAMEVMSSAMVALSDAIDSSDRQSEEVDAVCHRLASHTDLIREEADQFVRSIAGRG